MVLEVLDARDWTNEIHQTENTLVFNKSDLLEEPTKIDPKNAHIVSAKTGEGMNKLLDHISSYFSEASDDETVVTARKRHMRSIKEAYNAFCDAETGIAKNKELDLVAEELLQAQNSLAEVTGEFSTEDLLEAIFNSFCIGK
jgi:tRNA modification GTPase